MPLEATAMRATSLIRFARGMLPTASVIYRLSL
jgi:hypothetical protein